MNISTYVIQTGVSKKVATWPQWPKRMADMSITKPIPI